MFATVAGRSVRTKRASKSSATSRSSARRCSLEVVEQHRRGHGGRDAAGRRRSSPTRPRSPRAKARSTGRSGRPIHNLVRGLQPWPLVSGRLAGQRCLLHRTALTPSRSRCSAGTIVGARRGPARDRRGRRHVLQILAIQPEGRRVMTAREFLAGHRVEAGQRASSRHDCARPGSPRTRPCARSAPAAPICRMPSPAPARAWTTNAIARWPARSRPGRCAGRRAFDRVIGAGRRPADQSSRSRGARHPPPDRVSAPPPRSSAGVGGRQRRGQPGRTRREAKRRAARERRAAEDQPSSDIGCRSPRALMVSTAMRRCNTLPSRCRIRFGWSSGGSIGTGSRPPRSGRGSTTHRRR